MFVKYNENNEIISLFVSCLPDDMTDYIEIPDDDAIVKEYIEKNRTPVIEEPTQLDIIEAQVVYTAMMTDTLLEG